MADANAEVQLVGSTEVVDVARAYVDKVWETGGDLTEQGAAYNDVIKAIESDLRPDREAVVKRMRHDLRSRR